MDVLRESYYYYYYCGVIPRYGPLETLRILFIPRSTFGKIALSDDVFSARTEKKKIELICEEGDVCEL